MATQPPQPLSTDASPQSFTWFALLPLELRCFIWAYAAPRRSRVIQVFYDTKKESWTACRDSCGGLPSFLISKEAHLEAMKPYTQAFGTHVDFEADVIYISDPFFTIRFPQCILLNSEHAKKIRNIGMTSEMFYGLVESSHQWSKVYPIFGKVIQSFEGLRHLMVTLSDDESDFYLDFPEDGDEDEEPNDEDFEDAGEEWEAEGDLSAPPTPLSNMGPGSDNSSVNEATATEEEADLEETEADAVFRMSRGYFRQVGDIRFENPRDDGEEGENKALLMAVVKQRLVADKNELLDWIRPNMSIMAVKYGLKSIGDFGYVVHDLGDC